MRALFAAAALTALGACRSPAETCDSETSLLGVWSYSGRQDAPANAVLEGTMEITSESCAGFQGRLDLVQAEPSGNSRRLAGPLSGAVAGGAVRFDAWLTATPRQHVASFTPNAVTGSWALIGAASLPETGTFSLVRETTR